MTDDWQMVSLERRLDRLEAELERDREAKRRHLDEIQEFLVEVLRTGCFAAAIAYLLWG